MMLRPAAGLLLALAVLTGCGGGGDSTSPADEVLQTYFDDIATQTVSSLRDAEREAQPGSPAAKYATYLKVSTQAAIDGGQKVDQRKLAADRTNTGFKFCQGQGSDQVCFTYTKVTRAAGKVADFRVNGKTIADRLAVGTGKASVFRGLDAQARFLAAYQTTARGDLLVVVRITAGAGQGLDAVKGAYGSTGAAPADAAETFGPDTLEAGKSSNFMFAFPNTKVGGTLTLSTTAAPGGHPGTVALRTR